MDNLTEDALLNIIVTMEIIDLNQLYNTNTRFRKILDKPYTVSLLCEKHKLFCQQKSLFIDFVIEYFGSIYFPWFHECEYLEMELLRAAVVIRNRYLNSGDRIIHCDYSNEDICKAKRFLEKHGFEHYIEQVPQSEKKY